MRLLGTPVLLLLLCAVNACSPQSEPAPIASRVPGAMIIAYAPDSADTFGATRADSVFALDWLREIARVHTIELNAKSYPYGTLVEQIGYRRNGEDGYWLYKVNGQMIPKSSDAHRVAWSDTVTFFFDER